MTTNETTTPSPKPRRSFSVALRDAGGTVLRVVAVRRKDGTATTFAVHAVKKGDNRRGATQQHATVDEARAAVERLVTEAVKLGWTRSQRVGGFEPRPDAFDVTSLPKPAAKPAAPAKPARKAKR